MLYIKSERYRWTFRDFLILFVSWMPSHTLLTSLLRFGAQEDIPWKWKHWIGLTDNLGAPWHFEEQDHLPSTQRTHKWSNTVLASVKRFAEAFWGLSGENQVRFGSGKAKDEFSDGRRVLAEYIREKWTKGWDINREIPKIVEELGLDVIPAHLQDNATDEVSGRQLILR